VLASIRSAAVLGIAAYDVTVEVDVAAGLPAWTIVGLASSAVKEARERVTAALNNSGFSIPSRRVVCNLSPDNNSRPKDGAIRDFRSGGGARSPRYEALESYGVTRPEVAPRVKKHRDYARRQLENEPIESFSRWSET
jgi:hypothetical protein